MHNAPSAGGHVCKPPTDGTKPKREVSSEAAQQEESHEKCLLRHYKISDLTRSAASRRLDKEVRCKLLQLVREGILQLEATHHDGMVILMVKFLFVGVVLAYS